MSGWVKLHRSLLDHELMSKPQLFTIFAWCLLRAGHERRKVHGVTLEPGQFITGKLVASEELGVPPTTWYRSMQKLQDMNCITVKADRNWTIVTVCNWQTYQSTGDESGPHVDRDRTTDGPQMDHERTASGPQVEPNKNSITQESSSSSEDKNPPQKELSQRTRPKFEKPTVEQVAEYVAEVDAGIDPAAFWDHYEAKGWVVGKSPMKDWRASVRTWKRDRQRAFGFTRGLPPPESRTDIRKREEAEARRKLEEWARKGDDGPQ